MHIPLTNPLRLVFWAYSLIFRLCWRALLYLIKHKKRELKSIMRPGRKSH